MKTQIAHALGAARAAIPLAASHTEAQRAFGLFSAEHSKLKAAGQTTEAAELRAWMAEQLLALSRADGIGSLRSELHGYIDAAQALGR